MRYASKQNDGGILPSFVATQARLLLLSGLAMGTVASLFGGTIFYEKIQMVTDGIRSVRVSGLPDLRPVDP
jgi:hypothetical protein